jgi:hypothetical protein
MLVADILEQITGLIGLKEYSYFVCGYCDAKFYMEKYALQCEKQHQLEQFYYNKYLEICEPTTDRQDIKSY